MAWWGKIFGAAIGASIGGPIGAGIGAALGHIFYDAGVKSSSQSDTTFAFLYVIIAAMAKIAKADGTVSQSEIQRANQIFVRNFKLRGDALQKAKDIFRYEKDADTDLIAYFKQFRQITHADRSLSELLYNCIYAVAASDQDISSNEQRILDLAQTQLGLHGSYQRDYNQRDANRNNNGMSSKNAREILEVNAHAAVAEIKKAYREKCSKMHPDKLISKGVPEEMIEFANQQMSKYSEARDVLLNNN